MKKILIIGAGGLGKEVADLIRDIGGYDIAGFLDDNKVKKGMIINGVPVLDMVSGLERHMDVDGIVIAIADPAVRRRIYNYSRNMGFSYPNLIHPTVITGSGIITGMGNIVCAYSILSTESILHDFIIINPQCGIGHESEVNSFTTLYWSVHIGGNTYIGEDCELGSQSCALQGLDVADNVVLGAGTVVTGSISEKGTYVGAPAKRIK